MNREDMYNGITGIRSEFLEEADKYKSKKVFQWKKWIAVAACVALILSVLVPYMGRDQGAVNSPFVLTVYAAESSNDINLEQVGDKISVPISFFKTESGVSGFVFSYGDEKKGQTSTFAVFNNNKTVEVEPKIGELAGLTAMDGKHYIFYIPDEAEKAPYNIPIRLAHEGASYEIDIVVEQGDDGLEASLVKLTSYPIRDTEINVNENGQTYGKDVYANNTREEPDLIYAEAMDGTRGYVYASDLNAYKADSPEELLEQDKIYQEIWNNAPAGEVVVACYIPLYEADGKTVVGEFPITIGFKEKEDSEYPGLRE